MQQILYSGCLSAKYEFEDLEFHLKRNFLGKVIEFRRQAKVPFFQEPSQFIGELTEVQPGQAVNGNSVEDLFLRLTFGFSQNKSTELFLAFRAFIVVNPRSIAYAQPEFDTLGIYRRIKCWVICTV